MRPVSPRLTLAGLVLVITVVAVEAMAVATVMPTVVRHLHGLHWYGWSFTAYFLTDVIGMVDAGARCDRHGPRSSLVGGLAMFGVGLLTAGLAPDMAVFTLGRAFQGLGGGSLIVAVYVVIARAFDEERRPRVFAAMSGAWVVPASPGAFDRSTSRSSSPFNAISCSAWASDHPLGRNHHMRRGG